MPENHKPVETTAIKHADKLHFMITFVLTVAMYIDWLTCCVAVSQ